MYLREESLVFNPVLIFLTVWLTQVAAKLLYPDLFYPFLPLTWVILAVALISFLLGAVVIGFIKPPEFLISSRPGLTPLSEELVLKMLLYAYVLGASVVCYLGYKSLLALTGGAIDAVSVRNALINDFVGERKLFLYVRYFFLGSILSVFILSFSAKIRKKYVIAATAVGLISAILTTGRLAILLIFIGGAVALKKNKVITNRQVILGGLIFVFLFFLLAVVYGKGDRNSGIMESLFWNAKIYLFSSLACFNDFVHSEAQMYDSSLLIPNSVKMIASQVTGFRLEPKPDLYPFSYVPLACNTYTSLYPIYHDLGMLGVSVIFFMIGSAHYFVYKISDICYSPQLIYVFSISMYPLFMSVFEDAYFSSPGFWVMCAIPLIGYRLLAAAFGVTNKERL